MDGSRSVSGWRRRLLLALAMVLAAGAFLAGPQADARAYQHHGFVWRQPVVGYVAHDERLQPYVTEATRVWSDSAGLRLGPGSDIQVVVAPLLPPVHYANQPAQANVKHGNGTIQSCEVRIDAGRFFALSERTRQAVITHEIGHCLGLDHSKTPGIMQSPYLYDFSEDDRAAMLSLYGARQPLQLPYRAGLPVIASDQ